MVPRRRALHLFLFPAPSFYRRSIYCTLLSCENLAFQNRFTACLLRYTRCGMGYKFHHRFSLLITGQGWEIATDYNSPSVGFQILLSGVGFWNLSQLLSEPESSLHILSEWRTGKSLLPILSETSLNQEAWKFSLFSLDKEERALLLAASSSTQTIVVSPHLL